jgi:hypothetical protein
MDMIRDEQDLEFVRYMGHFLVSLGCLSVSSTLIPPSTERKVFTSAFVIELGSDWYLVTCGHVLEDIRKYLARHPHLLHTFVIHSGMGTFATDRELVHFDYREPVFSVNRAEGLDFGAIKLTASERAMLARNRIIAVQERVWDQELPPQFSKFAELGLPLQNMDLDQRGQAGIQPVYLRVEPYAGVEPQYAHQTDPMRYFKVMEPSRPDLDILGMSGCPVFAFWEKPGQDVQVIACAMQSAWLKTKRILVTVDLRFAGRQLRAAVNAM